MFDWDELRRKLKEEYLSSKREAIDCPLCSSQDYAVWHEDYFRVVKCDKCGLHYTNPRTACGELTAQYSSIDYSHGPLGYLFHPENEFWPQQMEEFQRAVRRLKKVKPKGKLLDIGCLFGGLLLAARAKGYEVSGVEVSHQAVEYASKKFGLNIFGGTIFEANFPGSAFDIITMTDVLDHVPKPLMVLQEVHRILKPGGVALIQAPDFESHRFRTMGTGAPEILPGHLVYFTRSTMAAALEKSGFRSITVYPVPIVKRVRLREFLPGFIGKWFGDLGVERTLNPVLNSTMLEAVAYK